MSNIFLNTQRTADGVRVEWDVRGPLPSDIARQIPFAASLALNRTAIEAVAVVRTETRKHFKSRAPQSEQYFQQSFQVTQFSNKNDLQIAFGLSRALMEGRAASLLDHETGADRVYQSRYKFPYLPAISSLRPNEDALLPRWAYPKALGLQRSGYLANGQELGADRTAKRRGSTRGKRAQENRKAFILRSPDGKPIGIFRRVPVQGMRLTGVRADGRKMKVRERRRRSVGQSTLELLFATPEVVRIKPKLGFYSTAFTAMEQRIQANFEGMLLYATNTERQAANAVWARNDAALIRQFTR